LYLIKTKLILKLTKNKFGFFYFLFKSTKMMCISPTQSSCATWEQTCQISKKVRPMTFLKDKILQGRFSFFFFFAETKTQPNHIYIDQ